MSSRGMRLLPGEWGAVVSMTSFIVLLHVVGLGSLFFVIAPSHYHVTSTQAFGVGLGLTAYTLGMRHAFDADHIAAIDTTTRKLMSDGRRPMSVGFWFSLGHSSVVFGLCALLAVGLRAFAGQLQDEGSSLRATVQLVGTSLSGGFLLLLGLINFLVLRQVLGVFLAMRRGQFSEEELEAHLSNRGLMARILGRTTRAISAPWQMFPVGLLFGLGFDTATEVGLLVLAGGAAASQLPWYAIMTIPVLFAAGMSLLDSVDGCFMNFAYGWAFAQPVRKVYYNLTVTGLGVMVALMIGTVEVASIMANRMQITSGPIALLAGFDLNMVGFFIVGLFVATWIIALAVWRFGDIEARWQAGLGTVDHSTEGALNAALDVRLVADSRATS